MELLSFYFNARLDRLSNFITKCIEVEKRVYIVLGVGEFPSHCEIDTGGIGFQTINGASSY